LLLDPQCRLLTLVGPGGIGKTRLALESASAQRTCFPQGVWFVSLAAINAAEFLVPTIASALGATLSGPSEPKEQLLTYLSDKTMLLVLDNFEHLLDGVGLLVAILERVPTIKLLVTSRERLNLYSEWVFDVQSFDDASAVAFFLQTARQTQV